MDFDEQVNRALRVIRYVMAVADKNSEYTWGELSIIEDEALMISNLARDWRIDFEARAQAELPANVVEMNPPKRRNRRKAA